MDRHTIELVQASWRAVEDIGPQAATLFYDNLFNAEPALQALFKTDMAQQGDKLVRMIGVAVRGLDDLDALRPALAALGVRHVAYGVQASDYDTVGVALLDTLAQGLGAAFTPEVQRAWASVYQAMATVMIAATQGGQQAA